MTTIPVMTCEKCGRQGRVNPELAGRIGKCPKCANTQIIPAAIEPIRNVIHIPEQRRAVHVDPELRTQLIALCGLAIVLLVFGRDWLPSGNGGAGTGATSTHVVHQSGHTSGPILTPNDGKSRVATPREKLSLGSSVTDNSAKPGAALLRILPPVEPQIGRRSLPFDCPSANGVRSVAFLADSKHALTVHQTDHGPALRKWNIENGAPIGQPTLLPAGSEYSAVMSSDGNRMAMTIASCDPGLLLINPKTGVTLRSRGTGRMAGLSAPAWCDAGSVIYGTPDGQIHQWLIIPDSIGFSLTQGQPVTCVGVSDAGYLLSGDVTGEIRLWNLGKECRYAASYPLHKNPIRVIETRRFAEGVVVLSASGEVGQGWQVHIWDLATQQLIHSVSVAGQICSLAVTPDWRRIVTGAKDGIVTVWDTIQGDEIESTPVHVSDVTSLATAPDGSCVMSGCYKSAQNRDVTVKLRPLPPARIPMKAEEDSEL